MECNGEIVSTVSLIDGIDLDYENIEGQWNTKIPYISIHKFATSDKFKRKNFGKKMMTYIENYARKKKTDLRIDTHEDNVKMKNFILSCGFMYCGVVYLSGKLKRIAYDKSITTKK